MTRPGWPRTARHRRAAQGGEPGPVVARVPRAEQGLALGDAQRVRRDPGMKRQPRIRPGAGDLGERRIRGRRGAGRDRGLVVGRRDRAAPSGRPPGGPRSAPGRRAPARAARRTPARIRGGRAPRARSTARRRRGTARPAGGTAEPIAPSRTAPTTAGWPHPGECRRRRRSPTSGRRGSRTRWPALPSRTARPWCTASPGPASGRRGARAPSPARPRSPSSPTMRLPVRKSPCTSASGDGGGRRSASHRRPISSAGRGSPKPLVQPGQQAGTARFDPGQGRGRNRGPPGGCGPGPPRGGARAGAVPRRTRSSRNSRRGIVSPSSRSVSR